MARLGKLFCEAHGEEKKCGEGKEKETNINHLDFALGQITVARTEKRDPFLKMRDPCDDHR